MEKIYRHLYDNPQNPDGTDKPNEFLGEFKIVEGDTDGYDFEAVGEKDGKRYRIVGQEVSALVDRHNAGTTVYIEALPTT